MGEDKFFREAKRVIRTATCLKIKSGAVVVKEGKDCGGKEPLFALRPALITVKKLRLAGE